MSCIFRGLSILICALALSGCTYLNFAAQKAHWRLTFQNMPSMSALNNLAPEESLIIHGELVYPADRLEPLLFVAVNNEYQKNELVGRIQIQKSATDYIAFLPKGEYELYVFADLDKSMDFEPDEVVGRATISVNPEHSIERTVVEGPPIVLDFEHPGKVDFVVGEKIQPMHYVYPSLDHEFFDPKYGIMGLYQPTDLIYHNQGFIFGLEEHDTSKTMVLFVHGANGTPRDWKFFAEGLDRRRFQPFFFYYPSGLQLDRLATVLAQVVNYVGASRHSHGIVLAAHSMGGLVALSAIAKLSEHGPPPYLRLYCSFSTPYGGNEVAEHWAKKAPVPVPAWNDVATNSDFLRVLAERPFPKRLPFYLHFTYKTKSTMTQSENSDGAITLHSQLKPHVQEKATRLIGFNDTHDGVLQSEAARASFLRILDLYVPKLAH